MNAGHRGSAVTRSVHALGRRLLIPLAVIIAAAAGMAVALHVEAPISVEFTAAAL
jgi:hypothetical protein